MMTDTKTQLLGDLKIHFRRLLLELEAMPPAMVHLGTIPGHVSGKQLTGEEFAAHALGWVELGCTWIQRGNKGEQLKGPKEGYDWEDTCTELSLSFYQEGRGGDFKQLCQQLNLAQDRLLTLLEQLTEDHLEQSEKDDERTSLDAILFRSILALHTDDVIRLRKWKKGLGWI